MKKIFNFKQFVKESFDLCHDCKEYPCMCDQTPEIIDTEEEVLDFCPECGHDWDDCECDKTKMTHVPAEDMHVANYEDYSFLDEEDEIEELDEKKKLNKGLQAFLDKKAGKKDKKEDKEGKIPTTKKEKELAAKYPPKDKITKGDVITAAKEKSKKK
jgi:hypothetical protein